MKKSNIALIAVCFACFGASYFGVLLAYDHDFLVTRGEAWAPEMGETMVLSREDETPSRVHTLEEITVVGNVPKVRAVRRPEGEWKCGNVRESRFGGSYRKCGYKKEDR